MSFQLWDLLQDTPLCEGAGLGRDCERDALFNPHPPPAHAQTLENHILPPVSHSCPHTYTFTSSRPLNTYILYVQKSMKHSCVSSCAPLTCIDLRIIWIRWTPKLLWQSENLMLSSIGEMGLMKYSNTVFISSFWEFFIAFKLELPHTHMGETT